ncbi:hypothetical protein N9R51_00575 [Candidatus Pelagibacter sp.]|nr:hypothetical protein [Candidatus Pelagibacter sp.]
MFALVDKSDNSITRMLNGNRGIQIGDLKYPRAIYTLWTEAERNAINIYSIVYDDTNKKDEKWYINTNQSFAFADNKVTATYGTATAKAHADTTWTQQQIDDGDAPDGADTDTVATRGLKYVLIQTVKVQAESELNKTDWYITRKAEKNTAIPSAITTHRDLVRSRQAAMETSITNASDTPALETLYTYTTDSDGVSSRPLAVIPTLD